MSISRNHGDRLFDADERELVEKTRQPKIRDVSDGDLANVIRLLRERRKRARDVANRQAREMRGKADAAGRDPARQNLGTQKKAEALAGALKRANNERVRRAKASAAPSQVSIARRALRLRKAAEKAARGSNPATYDRTAGKGLRPIESDRVDDLSRPMEIGRVSQFVKDAQAKRDSR